jgi:hypothetical protein
MLLLPELACLSPSPSAGCCLLDCAPPLERKGSRALPIKYLISKTAKHLIQARLRNKNKKPIHIAAVF